MTKAKFLRERKKQQAVETASRAFTEAALRVAKESYKEQSLQERVLQMN